MEYYGYLKALHLIFVVTWFAGLFYVPRLFIYHIEAQGNPEPDKSIISQQLALMTKRLWYIITWPSLVLASVFAFSMLYINSGLFYAPWMHIKLGFVVLLYAYHIKCHLMFKEMQRGVFRYSSSFMRLWNEGTTLILFAVVFLAITKSTTHWIWGLAGLIGLAAVLMLAIKAYKRYRESHESN